MSLIAMPTPAQARLFKKDPLSPLDRCLLLPNALGMEISWVSLVEIALGIAALVSVRKELE
jgi:hypothetical protein